MPGPLTKWHDDGASDAVGHDDGEDAQRPCIHGSELVFKGLVLGKKGLRHARLVLSPKILLRTTHGRWEVSNRVG